MPEEACREENAMKRTLLLVVVLLAVVVAFTVTDRATRPATLIATADAAEKPEQTASGKMVMWVASFVPGTRISWHTTPFVTKQLSPGESIENARADIEKAMTVHDLTMPRDEVAQKIMKDNALAEFNEFFDSTPNALSVLEERANRKYDRLFGPPTTASDGQRFLIDDPFAPTPQPPHGGGPGGGWSCECYWGQPCPSGCCLTKLFDSCVIAACMDCVPR